MSDDGVVFEEERKRNVVVLVPKQEQDHARDKVNAAFVLGQVMKNVEDGIAKGIVVIELRENDGVSVQWSSGPTFLRIMGALEVAKMVMLRWWEAR